VSKQDQEPYSFVHGDFHITVLSDGHISISINFVAPEGPPARREKILGECGDVATQTVRYAMNVPLLRTAHDAILVDIGAGETSGPTGGELANDLARVGVAPKDVTKIILTHAHPDHIGAMLNTDGTLRYPNATFYMGVAEWEYWTQTDVGHMPTQRQTFAIAARRSLFPVQDRAVRVAAGYEIVPGISVLDTAGHTPGHISLEISGGDGLLISADAATNEIESFDAPTAMYGFDMDHEAAARTRASMLDRAANDRIKLLGYHWRYPGVGYAQRAGNAYRFLPET
jgi:glyoxylase-like metal-dependent hydrolase (beta-lactamase superfamily II)